MIERERIEIAPFWRFVIWVGLFYLLYIVYRGTFSSPFVYDDTENIVFNPDFRQADAFWRLFWSHPSSMQFDHRPVVGAVSLLNFKIFGLKVATYHAFNLLVHWMVAVAIGETLILVVRRLALPLSNIGAIAIAAIWALHPLNSVTVIYISQRAESMMTLFYVLAIACLLASKGSRKRNWWLVGSAFSVALAMGSKEVAITLPVVLLLFDRVCLSSSFREILTARRWYYVVILVVLAGFVTWWFSGVRIQELGGNALANPWEYLKMQARVVVNYLRLVFWPSPLIFVYDSRFVTSWQQWVPQAVLLILLLWVSVVNLSRRVWISLGLLTFFLVLAPTSSVMPIPQEVAAEWRIYLPSAAILAIVVGTLWVVATRIGIGSYGVGIVAALILAFSWVSFERGKVFASKQSIWSDVAAKQPTNHRAWVNLAVAELERDEIEKAKGCARQLIMLGRRFDDPYSAVAGKQISGWVALREEKFEEAQLNFEEAIAIDSSKSMIHANLAAALAGQKKFEEALVMVSIELDRNPESLRAKLVRAKILQDRLAQNSNGENAGESRQRSLTIPSRSDR